MDPWVYAGAFQSIIQIFEGISRSFWLYFVILKVFLLKEIEANPAHEIWLTKAP